jgi:hypothetical protein
MKCLIVVVLLSAVLTGCASLMAKSEYTPFLQTIYAPKHANDTIDILAMSPKREYVEIGIISCRDTDKTWNLSQVLLKAREVGADAIVITKKDHLTGADPIVGAPIHYGLEAVAIKYK